MWFHSKNTIPGPSPVLTSLCVCLSIVTIASCRIPIGPRPSDSTATDNPALTIWWEKGFNASEDEAIQTLVTQWEKHSGKTVNLVLLPSDTLVQKTQRALTAGKLPDILYASKADYELYPRLAAEQQLADVSDLIVPTQDQYDSTVLQSIRFHQEQRYYAVPIAQYTLYIHYWKHFITQTNRNSQEIPQDWQGFWNYWKLIQTDLSETGQSNPKGIGITLSKTSGDTYIFFEQLLEAHDVKLLDEAGKLQIQRPEVQAGITQCLNWSTQLLEDGYVPEDAKWWLNPDNNRELLNRAIVMTANSTLSIPKAIRHDPRLYHQQLGTIEFPQKPSGEPMRYIKSIKQAVIFADAPSQATAKQFLGYLIQPKVMAAFLQNAGGRYLPASNQLLALPYWSQTTDPHLKIATKIITQRPTRLHYSAIHPAYARVQEQKIWGTALHRVLVEGWSTTKATNEAIASIQTIFQQWDDTKSTR